MSQRKPTIIRLVAAGLVLIGGLTTTGPEAGSAPVARATAVRTAPSAPAGGVPFYGINLNQNFARLAGTSDPKYTQGVGLVKNLGVGVARASVTCVTPAASGIPVTLMPNHKDKVDCAHYSGPDEVQAIGTLLPVIAPVTVGPMIHILYLNQTDPATGAPMADAADLAWRQTFYTQLGAYVGRELGGKVPYYELGNEPDYTCILPEGAAGVSPGDYDPACVARVRVAMVALQAGIRQADPAAKFAIGTSGIRWGITDALWNGIDPATGVAIPANAVKWDYTVVHWYYIDGYSSTGSASDQQFGYQHPENINAAAAVDPGVVNPAQTYRDKYKVPILITEFGVTQTYSNVLLQTQHEFATPQNRVQSFQRVLTNLYLNSEEYNVAGITAFALFDEDKTPATANTYGLVSYAAGTGYSITDLGRAYPAYQSFIAGNPVVDHTRLTITSPAPGGVVASNPVTFTGTGAPGWTVTVKGSSGKTLCTATVATDDSWSCTLTVTLVNGDYLTTTTQTDGSSTSVPFQTGFHVGPYTPVSVTSPDPASGIGVTAPAIYAGVGQPYATVTVSGNSGRLLCSTTVTATGTWSCVSSIPLGTGSYVSYVQQSVDEPIKIAYQLITWTPGTLTTPTPGGYTGSSTPTFSGKGTPAATVTVAGNSGKTLCTGTVSPAGTWSCISTITLASSRYLGTVTYTLAGHADRTTFDFLVVSPVTLTAPTPGGYTGSTTPTFTGTGTPAATVTVAGNSGKTLCTGTVSPAGTWSCTSTITLTPGSGRYLGTVTQTVGAHTDITEYDFLVVKPVTVTAPAPGATVTGPRPTYTGTGEPHATITITGSSGKILCTTTVSSTGNWSCSSTITLVSGTYLGTTTETIGGTTITQGTLAYTVK
jgi:hypothetical protein